MKNVRSQLIFTLSREHPNTHLYVVMYHLMVAAG